jgi:hypothetical protein
MYVKQEVKTSDTRKEVLDVVGAETGNARSKARFLLGREWVQFGSKAMLGDDAGLQVGAMLPDAVAPLGLRVPPVLFVGTDPKKTHVPATETPTLPESFTEMKCECS